MDFTRIKITLFFILLFLSINGCNNGSKKPISQKLKTIGKDELKALENKVNILKTTNDSLSQKNVELENKNTLYRKKDMFIRDITKQFIVVKRRLRIISENAVKILKNSNNIELQILDSENSSELENYLSSLEGYFDKNIVEFDNINEQVGLSKSELNDISKKLEAANFVNKEFKELLHNLSSELILKKELISSLYKKIQLQEKEILKLNNELNTAYYVADTRDNLIEKGIIHEVGNGFLGIGGKEVLVPGLLFSKKGFIKIDIRNKEEFYFKNNIVEIIPERSSWSRSIINSNYNNKGILIIKNKKIFWETKVVVFVIEN